MKPFNRNQLRASLLLGLTLSLGIQGLSFAQTSDELLKSAQSKYRARQNDAAQADAVKARELATTDQDRIEADMLLAQILARQNKSAQGLKILEGILQQAEADATTVAKARITACGILLDQKKYDQARQMVEPVLAMDVPTTYLNQAQRDHLRSVWGLGNWLTQGNLKDLQQEVQAILAQEKEAWPGRNLRVLQDAARLVTSAYNFPIAREYYAKALELEGVPPATQFALRRDNATALYREGKTDEAYAALEKLLATEDLSASNRVRLHLDQATIASSQERTEQALKFLDEALAVEGVSAAQEADIRARITRAHLEAHELAAAAAAVRKLMAIQDVPTRTAARESLAVIDSAVNLHQFELAESLTAQLMQLDLSASEQGSAAARLALIRMSRQDIAGAREALQRIPAEDLNDRQKLVQRLQLAGTSSGQGQQKEMTRLIEQALADHDQLPAQEKIRALWDAAQLYFQARHYPPARLMIHQAERFGNQAVKTYRVQGVERAPRDVGQWLSSGLLDQPGVADARFYPYSQQDAAAMFAADVRTERPFGDMNNKGPGPAPTRVAMVYDALGWHIYVQSQEPKIDQIMASNGQGGSSLEMFFTPGTYNEPYYQWITRLSQNETTVYDWNSPHRFYRTLESRPGYFRCETQALADGWGTAIFISWEAFYDQMSMLHGEKQVWRFSMQRWDPAGSVTWGGRVHETGRWGHIVFDAPTPKLKLAIQRNLIRKAWWHYQDVLKQQTTLWTGLRGDQAFYAQAIKPMADEAEARSSQISQIDQWDAGQVDQVYRNDVPRWQEVDYIIADKREAYLRERFTAGQ